MQPLKMNNGQTIPEIGLGLWLVTDEKECIDAVNWALKDGYRHFDSAQYYGNEGFLGSAIKSSGIKRDEVFITTKISVQNMQRENVVPGYEQSLKNLQMDHVDLLLLHFPVPNKRQKAWKQLEEIYESGKAKSIGVSNYTVSHLVELLRDCKVKPAINQVELHVYLQQPELLEFCKRHDIIVEAYSPLAHGHDMDNAVLAEIGKKYGKSPAQIMIRWCLDTGTVALPKSVHENRIKDNYDVFDFKLNGEDMKKLTGLGRDLRTAWDPSGVA